MSGASRSFLPTIMMPDNRPPTMRWLDHVVEVAHLVRVAGEIIERDLCDSRAIHCDGDSLTFVFQRSSLDALMCLLHLVERRAASVAERAAQVAHLMAEDVWLPSDAIEEAIGRVPLE